MLIPAVFVFISGQASATTGRTAPAPMALHDLAEDLAELEPELEPGLRGQRPAALRGLARGGAALQGVGRGGVTLQSARVPALQDAGQTEHRECQGLPS